MPRRLRKRPSEGKAAFPTAALGRKCKSAMTDRHELLKRVFGFDHFRGVQESVIELTVFIECRN